MKKYCELPLEHGTRRQSIRGAADQPARTTAFRACAKLATHGNTVVEVDASGEVL
jgi:hypothetical protein